QGVADRCGDGRETWLADASGCGITVDDRDFNLRRLVHTQQLVIVKVRLLHATLVEFDIAVLGRRYSEDDTAFHLGSNDVGIHRRATVDGAEDTTDTVIGRGIHIIEFQLDNLRDIGTKALVYCQPLNDI